MAIVQGLGSCDGLAVEPGRPLRGQVAEEVAPGSCLDLGVLAGDVGIAEDADLGAFVQAKAAALGRPAGESLPKNPALPTKSSREGPYPS